SSSLHPLVSNEAFGESAQAAGPMLPDPCSKGATLSECGRGYLSILQKERDTTVKENPHRWEPVFSKAVVEQARAARQSRVQEGERQASGGESGTRTNC